MTSPRRGQSLIIVLLGMLCVISPFAIDLYLPAFSSVARELGTKTAVIALSVSSYFIGFALGQILYGPLLDRFGRKRPLYAGLALYVAASVGCAMAHSVDGLILWRFAEAVGGCVAQVAALAMVRDFFHTKESAKILSMLFLIIGVSPLLAPTVGSFLVSWLGWRWIFAALAAYAIVTVVLIFALLPEGHEPDTSISLAPLPIIENFWFILREPQFATYALAGAFSFAGLFVFVSGAPVLFMDGYHVSTRGFGLVFAVLVGGFIAGNQLNVALLRIWTSERIFFNAVLFQVFVGAALLAARGHAGLKGMMVLFFFFLLSCGLTYPNAAALGMAPFARDAGSASALLGFLQAGTGSLISAGVGILGSSVLEALLAGSAVVALGILLVGRTRIAKLAEAAESIPMGH